jgi:anti-anti-sigma factor
MALDIDIAEIGSGGRRISLGGRLDTQTAPMLEERLWPLIDAPGVTAALFDLAELEYIGSAGIRVLVKVRKALEARGGGVAVAHLQPMVRQVFDIVKALPSIDVFATDAELDAFVESMRQRAPHRARG